MFTIDRSAPTVEVDEIRLLGWGERKTLAQGAQLICESFQDNDAERWMLTAGGQFLRFTGSELENAYVTDAAYALEMLAGFCDDDVMEKLVQANAFAGAVPLPAAS